MTLHRVQSRLSAVYGDAGDFLKGAADTAVDCYYFFPDLFRYVTGIDAQFGAGRNLDWKGMAKGLWRHFDWTDPNPFSTTNPITGAGMRTLYTGSKMIYGTLDLWLAHYPNTFFNEKLKMNIPYFSPPPQTARELGQDISLVVFIGTLPHLRSTAKRALKMKSNAKPVSESSAFRQYSRALTKERWEETIPKPAGAYMVLPIVEAFLRRILQNARKALRRDQTEPAAGAEGYVEWNKRADAIAVRIVAQEAASNPIAREALKILVDQNYPGARDAIVQVETKLAGPLFESLLREASRNPGVAIKLVDATRHGQFHYAAQSAAQNLSVADLFEQAKRNSIARVALVELTREGNVGARLFMDNVALLADAVEEICHMRRAEDPLDVLNDLAGVGVAAAYKLLTERGATGEAKATNILSNHARNGSPMAMDAMNALITQHENVEAVICLACLEREIPHSSNTTLQKVRARTTHTLDRLDIRWIAERVQKDLQQAEGPATPRSLVALTELAKSGKEKAAKLLYQMADPRDRQFVGVPGIRACALEALARAATDDIEISFPRFLRLAKRRDVPGARERALRFDIAQRIDQIPVSLPVAYAFEQLARLGHEGSAAALAKASSNRTFHKAMGGDWKEIRILKVLARNRNGTATQNLKVLLRRRGRIDVFPTLLRVGVRDFWEELRRRNNNTPQEREAGRQYQAGPETMAVVAQMRRQPVEILLPQMIAGATPLDVLRILSETGHKGAKTALAELERTGRYETMRAIPPPPQPMQAITFSKDERGKSRFFTHEVRGPFEND